MGIEGRAIKMQRYKELLLNVCTVLVTVAALSMVAIRIHEGLFARRAAAGHEQRVPDWRELASSGNRIGRPDALVTITEFTDFQCPFCRETAADLRQIRQEMGDKFAVVVRYFPLPGHKFAQPAAEAAECAARQGAFERFHNLLFDSQAEIGTKAWTDFAAAAGVPNAATFRDCMSSGTGAAAVARDKAAGQRHGVSATPTLLINDREINWYPGREKLADMIRSALDAARSTQ